MHLSKNFTETEFTNSFTATSRKINNSMPNYVKENAIFLCQNYLQKFRDFLKQPIVITSGYRSSELNKAVGGSATSKHTTGEAVDITVRGIPEYQLTHMLYKFLKENNLDFDQLIWEKSKTGEWVHFGIDRSKNPQRKQVMKMENNKYTELKF